MHNLHGQNLLICAMHILIGVNNNCSLLACRVGLILASECSVLSWGKLELPSDFYRSRMLGRERNLYQGVSKGQKEGEGSGGGAMDRSHFCQPPSPHHPL